MTKALLIKSYTTKGGTQGVWNDLDDAFSYVQGINTGKVLDNLTADKLNALISGVPSPWARARLFKFAFDTLANPDPNIESSGLDQFYEMLCAEWKGLIAVMALFPDRIKFSEPIVMDSTGDNYDIASAFGRMLFDDSDVWSDQDALSKDPDAKPYIQLIYYKNHLVGGTSPMTGFFTGVNYSKLKADMTDINWYRNGLFEDPTRYISTPALLQKLYLFVKNMNGNLEQFEKKVNSQRRDKRKLDLSGFKAISRKWEDELFKKGQGKLVDKGPVAQYSNLRCPFSTLLNSNVPVYLKPDFTFTYTNDGDYKVIGDVQNLLSNDRFVVGWAEEANQRPKRSDGPIYYVQVRDIKDNSCYYFSLPLSENGLDIFKNSLSGLLGYTQGGNSRLKATITDSGQLAVSMLVEIDGQEVALNTREYEISWQNDPGKVILWPNFVSERWNKYYLYSEFTAEAEQQFVPIFRWQGDIVRNINGEFLTSRYELQPDEQKQVDVKKLVIYPSGEGDDLPKYNIVSSDKPMAGLSAIVKETGKEVHAGFLMFRQTEIEDRTSVDMNIDAIVGFDFGSNNTCVYYNADDRGPMPIKFENYRAVLVGQENNDRRSPALNDELLFFSNYPSDNGQVKSWLHEHDSRYNKHRETEEIAGGVPVNRPNVLVNKMTQFDITTQAGILHYNMKWLDSDKGMPKKLAFMKSMWLQTCAYLYKNRIKPTQINWSYPGSMMESDVNDIEKIFEELTRMTPITRCRVELPENRVTEAEAVCSFALSQDFGLNRDNMFLGIDVGGSTSDILLLAKDPENGGRASLYRESSVRMAAGVFFDAVTKSETFREALVSFHEGKKTGVYVANIKEMLNEPSKAPYYLNNIFDQLKTAEDYEVFYSSIDTNAKVVFTIPAYVTGLLLFYSGMLIGKTIKMHHLDNIKRIDVLSFGKGGRLFHWLRNSAGRHATSDYYSNCVNAGVKCVCDTDLVVKYRDEIEVDNKAEVAKGLCDMRELFKIDNGCKSDICGEKNVSYTTADGNARMLSVEDELTGDYFANEMNNFDFSGAVNFAKYMDIFIDFVSQKTSLYKQADKTLRDDVVDVPARISAFVTKDNEYKKARNNSSNGFHYHQPIIIAEGACFLEVLIKKVFS
jgi:hypothetical protein